MIVLWTWFPHDIFEDRFAVAKTIKEHASDLGVSLSVLGLVTEFFEFSDVLVDVWEDELQLFERYACSFCLLGVEELGLKFD